MKPINIYKGDNGKPSFAARGVLLATVTTDRPHEFDEQTGVVIVPSVRDGPEFTAGQALLSAQVGIFGFRTVAATMALETGAASSAPAKGKGKKK